MAEENWTARVSSNKSKLCELTYLSLRFLDKCVELNVLTRDEKEIIECSNLDYDRKSKFYDIIQRKDNGRFKVMIDIMRESETRQSDDVLNILVTELRQSQPGSSEEIQETRHQLSSMTLSLRPKPTGVWFDVVQPLVDVVGRDETLAELHKFVTRNAGNENNVGITSQLTCVCGLGGVGKTTLVRKYACENTKFFDGNVIWIKANNEQQIRNSVERLACFEEVNIGLHDWNNRDVNMTKIFKFFSDRKSLFIFDDVKKYVGIVDKFLPLNLGLNVSKPYILMTSRKESLDLKIKDFKLGVPSFEHIAKLMTTKLEMETEEDKELAYNLAVQLKGLPLAAQQAISYIQKLQKRKKRFAKQRNPFEEYLTLLQDSSKGQTLLDVGVAEDYGKTVFQTWNTTMTSIFKTEEYGPSAERIMNILSYFNHDSIKFDILEIIQEKETIEESLTLLAEYSMLEVEEGVISIHPLVQQVIRFKNKSIEPKLLAECLFILRNRSDTLEHSHTIWKSALHYTELIKKFPTVGIRLCENVHLGNIESADIFQETSTKFNEVFGLDNMHTLELDCIRIISLCHDINDPDYGLISRLNDDLVSRLKSCLMVHTFPILPVLSRLAGSLLKVGKLPFCPIEKQEVIIRCSLKHYEKIRQVEQEELNMDSNTKTSTQGLIMECRQILSEIEEKSLLRRMDKTTELRRTLTETTFKTNRFTNLIGASGVGKTTLALKYIEEFANCYEDVIWINASTKEAMEMSLLKTAARLGIPLYPEADGSWWSLNEQLAGLINVMGQLAHLFVFYKLGRPSYSSNVFFSFMESHKSSPGQLHLLFVLTETIDSYEVNAVHLDVFKEEEAIQLICNFTNSDDRELADRLTEKFHRFPLALHYAIKYICRHSIDLHLDEPIESNFCPIQQYLKLCDKHSAEMQCSDKLQDTVQVAWNITKHKIEAIRHGLDAIKIMKIISYLDPDELSLDLIHSIFPAFNANECSNILQEYGVVGDRNSNTHIHPLLQKIIRKENRNDKHDTKLLILKNADFEYYGKPQLIFLFNEFSRTKSGQIRCLDKQDIPILQEILTKISEVFGPLHRYAIKAIRRGIVSLNHPDCPDQSLLLSLCQQIILKLNECSSVQPGSFSKDGIGKLFFTLPFKIENSMMSKEFAEIELQLCMAQFEFHKRIQYRQMNFTNYLEHLFKCLQEMEGIDGILTVSHDIENFVCVSDNVHLAVWQMTDLAKYLLQIGRDGTTVKYNSLIIESLAITQRLDKFIQENNHVTSYVNSLQLIHVKVACLLLTQQNEKTCQILDPLFKKINYYTHNSELKIIANILKEIESFGHGEFEMYFELASNDG